MPELALLQPHCRYFPDLICSTQGSLLLGERARHPPAIKLPLYELLSLPELFFPQKSTRIIPSAPPSLCSYVIIS